MGLRLAVQHAGDAPVGGAGKRQQPHFDDLVAHPVESGRFAVDIEPPAHRRPIGVVHHLGQHELPLGAGLGRVVGIHHGIHLLGDVVVECLAASMGARRKTAPTASASR